MYKLKFETFDVTNDNLVSLDGNLSLSPIMDDLKADEIRVKFEQEDLFIAGESTRKGKPVYYYSNDKLIGKFFISKFEQKAETIYEVTLESIIGVWGRKYYRGNLFSGTTLQNVVADVVGNEATVSELVADIPMYGFLKYATKREAMHMILFASGCILIKDSKGNPFITSIRTNVPPIVVPENEISVDNLSSTSTEEASKVNVTEHAYAVDKDADYSIAFDNTDGTTQAERSIVKFSVPIQTDDWYVEDAEGHRGSGLSVEHLTPASCEVSGLGKLYVKQYMHTESEQHRTNTEAYDEQEVGSSDCTLVNTANSQNVLDRLYNYYTQARHAKFDILYANYKCGDKLSAYFWQDDHIGFLTNVDIMYSKIIKAACEIAVNYDIVPVGNNFKNFALITGNGSFTVPEGIKNIRVILIGGGTGGSAGYRSKVGKSGDFRYRFKGGPHLPLTDPGRHQAMNRIAGGGEGGKGGKGGTGGRQGKVMTYAMGEQYGEVIAGITLQFTCGVGGAGGVGTVDDDEEHLGTDGTDTTMRKPDGTVISSGSGIRNEYINIFTGEVCADNGYDGKPGGDGGWGGTACRYGGGSSPIGGQGSYPVSGEVVHYNEPGENPGLGPDTSYYLDGEKKEGYQFYAGTGGASGPEVGETYQYVDANGQDPSINMEYDTMGNAHVVIGGKGGDSRQPKPPATPTTIGMGGQGGFGASGPGGGGGVSVTADASQMIAYIRKIAIEIWQGKWGDGEDRIYRFETEGLPYAVFQGVLEHAVYMRPDDPIWYLRNEMTDLEISDYVSYAAISGINIRWGAEYRLFFGDYMYGDYFFGTGGGSGNIAAGGDGGQGGPGGAIIYY